MPRAVPCSHSPLPKASLGAMLVMLQVLLVAESCILTGGASNWGCQHRGETEICWGSARMKTWLSATSVAKVLLTSLSPGYLCSGFHQLWGENSVVKHFQTCVFIHCCQVGAFRWDRQPYFSRVCLQLVWSCRAKYEMNFILRWSMPVFFFEKYLFVFSLVSLVSVELTRDKEQPNVLAFCKCLESWWLVGRRGLVTTL